MDTVTSLEAEGPPLLLVGLGDGRRLAWLLEHTHRTVFTWEPDLAIWTTVLETVEGAEHLRSGRWVPLFGPDLLRCVAARDAVVVHHPTFQAAYADAVSLLQPDGPLVLVVQGELFVDDVAGALRSLGCRVLRWDISHLPSEEHTHILSTVGADLAVSVNTQDGLAEVLAMHHIPYAVWEIDPNTSGPAPLSSPARSTVVFTYRSLNIPMFRRVGYPRVEHLPLAAPIQRYRPVSRSPTIPIAFVGASMAASGQQMRARLKEMFAREPNVLRAIEHIWTIQRQDDSRWRVPELMESMCPGVRARIRREHAGLDVALMVGEVSAAEKRLSWLSHLGALGLQVWGDPGWSLTTAHGVQWKGWADHFADLPEIYASAAIHVDVPRLYQQDAVAMRVFDVMAAGGFLLAEYSAELVALFTPGVHLDTYRSPRELVDKCRFYLSQPELRQKIAAAGCALVRQSHSIEVRVAYILGRMGISVPASAARSGRQSP